MGRGTRSDRVVQGTRTAALLGLLGAVLMTVASPARGEEPAPTAVPQVEIRVDPRIELTSIVFRLAGHPEYNQGRLDRYVEDVDAHFGPFRDHAVVPMARRLRRTRGISYDACMSFAVHLDDDGETFNERIPFDPRPESLERRWTVDDARTFLDALNDFATASDFRGFFDQHQALYEAAEANLATLLDDQARLEWFPEFFGERPGGRFRAVLGLLNGPMNYGPHCRLEDGTEELYCILGAWESDADGVPTYGSIALETVIHEFCHSYANAIIDAHFDALEAPAGALFEPVAEAMRRQAYGNPKTMLYESLVRACVIRYLRQHGGTLAATRRTLEDQMRGFRWIGALANLLADYEQDREMYPTLDDFAPRIIAFFEEQAEDLKEDED